MVAFIGGINVNQVAYETILLHDKYFFFNRKSKNFDLRWKHLFLDFISFSFFLFWKLDLWIKKKEVSISWLICNYDSKPFVCYYDTINVLLI